MPMRICPLLIVSVDWRVARYAGNSGQSNLQRKAGSGLPSGVRPHGSAPQRLMCCTTADGFDDTKPSVNREVVIPGQPDCLKPYLQPATMDLVRLRQAYRLYVTAETVELRRRRLLVAFAAFVHCWRDTHFTMSQLGKVASWFRELNVSIARAVRFIQLTGSRVRRAVRADRIQHLDAIKAQVARQDLKGPRELFRALRRAFPQARSSRRNGFQPLPQVQLEDGSFAQTQDQRLARWGAFFAEQEAGEVATSASYTAALAEQKELARPAADQATRFHWKTMITLAETEVLLLNTKSRKAVGYDGISSELLKLDPPASARRLYPLFVKSMTSIYEPVAYRGGSLMILAKRAGAASQCTDFRSILLATTTGKMYHKSLRNRLLPLLQASKNPLQFGATPGVGIEALSLIARAFKMLRRLLARAGACLLRHSSSFLQSHSSAGGHYA